MNTKSRVKSLALILGIVFGGLFAAPLPASAEGNLKEIVSDFFQRKPMRMGPKSVLLLGGMADHLTSRCKGGLSLTAAERVRIAGFMTTATTRATVGGRYSDPNLGRGIDSQVSGMVIYAGGGKLVEKVDCGEPATLVLRRIVEVVDSQRRDRQARDFVRTCTPIHDARRCACLAELGEAVFPNFRDRSYSRGVVYGIIQGNPLLGFQIALRCGIVNY